MSRANAIVQARAFGFPWEMIDPFLFCLYHDDRYPRGHAQFGPDASLASRVETLAAQTLPAEPG